MKRLKLLGAVCACMLFGFFANANAATVYVGSYHVTDGASWDTNPLVYSALEAAELVFGPAVGGSYSISINGIDPNTITNTGWYAEIGVGPGVFAENFSQDLGTPGYNGGDWSDSDDISAYVNDDFFDLDEGTNYVFFTSAVPVPAAIWLFGSGLLGLIGIARKKAA